MNDKQMLEMAAKAAGIAIDEGTSRITGTMQTWRPLTDDGDAFRLGVKLHLFKATEKAHWLIDDKTDFYAATRRAITRAAAEIGGAL